MRNNVHQRFTIGVTIENTTMRLWRGDRTATVVSGTIDLLKVGLRIPAPESHLLIFILYRIAKM